MLHKVLRSQHSSISRQFYKAIRRKLSVVEVFGVKTRLVLRDMKIEKYLNQVSTAKFNSSASQDAVALGYTKGSGHACARVLTLNEKCHPHYSKGSVKFGVS
jgi:hypothetical protein